MAPRGQNHKRKRERDRSLVENERAIEGLPIRLVIALFVGVAALFLMLQVLDLFDEDDLDRSEITIEIQEGATLDLDDDTDELEFTVIDGNGQELEEGEDFEGVIFQPDTALGETGFFTDDDGFIELNGDDGTIFNECW